MTYNQPITGVAANRQQHWFPQYDEDRVRLRGRSVAVALARGAVVFADEATGCLVQDNLGPRSIVAQGSQTGDITANFDSVGVGGPYMELSGASTRSVGVNPCGGVALADSWTLRYDEIAQAWQVTSEVWGPQLRMAREDERYISDRGEVTFTLRAGLSPSIQGMEFSFTVDAGVATADGDNDGDGTREADFAVPTDPVAFHYEVGPRDGDYYVVDDRPLMLVLGAGSDTALRVDPQEADVDVAWK